jgi:hypothetical protein
MENADDVKAKDYFEILCYYDKMRVRLKATCIAVKPYPHTHCMA